jgi:multicomponent Na+:H+ antiporter subunit G
VRDILTAVFLWLGVVFPLLAAVGLLRLPDVYTRMQATSKASTLGIALVMIAVAVHFGTAGMILRAAAVIVLFFITTPIAAHVIARAAYFSGVKPWHGAAAGDEMATDELQAATGPAGGDPARPA